MRYAVSCTGCRRVDDVDGPEKLVAVVAEQAEEVRRRIKEIIEANIPGTKGVGIVFRRVCPVCDTNKEQPSYEFDTVRIKT